MLIMHPNGPRDGSPDSSSQVFSFYISSVPVDPACKRCVVTLIIIAAGVIIITARDARVRSDAYHPPS